MRLRPLAIVTFAFLASAFPAAAAQPFRLFEIFVLRYIKDVQGATIMDRGTLTAAGEFKHATYSQIAAPEQIPADAMNKNLLPSAAWLAYDALGRDALANFNLTGTLVGDALYFVVTVADQPKLDVGILNNVSSRGLVAPGGEPLIAGFVIDERPRRVLIRGVGPGLGAFNVAAPLANPALKIFRQGEAAPFAANDDWDQQANVGEIEQAAATVGAFALKRATKDAALLLELPPGVYTAQLSSAEAAGGTALLEFYVLP